MNHHNLRKFFRYCIFALAFCFFVIPNHAKAAYPLGNEAVLYHFEDAATATSTNSGSGGATYDGTFVGNASTSAAIKKFGSRSGSFGETGDYLKTYFGSSTNPTLSSISVSLWIYKNEASAGCNTGDDDHFFGVSGPTVNTRFYLRCTVGHWGSRFGASAAANSATAINHQSWEHIVLVFDAANDTPKLYVNNVLRATSATVASYTLQDNFFVGNINDRINNTFNEGSNSYIDEVGIYNAALSGSDITALYKAGDDVAPVISAIATSSVSTSGITIGWTTDENASTQIEYGLTSSYGSSTTEIDNAPYITSHSQTLGGLISNTTYHYRVVSRDPSDTVGSSTDSTFTTSAGADVTPPVISAIATSSVSTSGITIGWTTDENSSSRVIYGLTSSYGSTTNQTDTSPRVTTHLVALSSLVSSTLYHFAVVSIDSSGNSSTSSDSTFTTAAAATPGQPTSLIVTPYENKVFATWTAATGTVSDYRIEYKLTSTSTWTTFVDGVSTSTFATITGLSNGSTYDFRVTALNGATPGAVSSSVSGTPSYRINFVSATPSESSTLSTSSFTAYASSSVPSNSFASSTHILRLETSGGALVSQISTTTRYGDYNLTHLTNTLADSNLSLADNTSGISYVGTTDTLFVVHNRSVGADSTIDEVDKNGALIRTITCTSCGDTEGITLISSLSNGSGGFNHTFMISTENNTASSTIFRVVIPSTGTASINATDFFNLGIPHGVNFGIEGITYNPTSGTFYVIREKSTPAIYEITLGSAHTATSNQICTNLNFTTIATDFSDLTYRNGILYILSHENDRLIPVNISSTSTCAFVDSDGNSSSGTTIDTGDYLNTIPVGVTTQPEGVSWDSTGDTLYVVGEADFMAKYRTNVFTTQNTFSGLSNGSYVLKSSFIDANGVTSSAADRSFNINVDITAPVISAVATSSLATTSVTILWTTNEGATGQVEYGLSSTYSGSTTLDSSYTTSHSQPILNLNPATTYHYRIISADASGNIATSTDATFTTSSVSDTTPPSVSITSPSNSAVVSGSSVSLSATSSDNIGVVGVLFKVDNVAVGAEDTTPSYGVTWNSTLVTDGTHSIIAVARDAGANYATSTVVNVTVDNTAPVRSAGAPTGILATNSTGTTISLTTNESATCRYDTNAGTAYGSMTAFSTTGGTSHSSVVSGLSNGSSYSYYVKCSDVQGNINSSNYTISFSVALDTDAPLITSISSNTPTQTSATITWTTDEVASSKISYGLSTSTGNSTTETDISPRVTLHTVVLSGLKLCTSYDYQVISRDTDLNTATSTANSFTTAGCAGSANVLSEISQAVATSSGGVVSLVVSSKGPTLTIPAGFAATNADFQIKKLDKTLTLAETGSPSGLTLASDQLYDIKAYSNVSTTISSFAQPIIVSIQYLSGDIVGIDETTLTIRRWDGTSWNSLTGCSTNVSTKTVTCSTSGFSVFGLFGVAVVAPPASSVNSNVNYTVAPLTGKSSNGNTSKNNQTIGSTITYINLDSTYTTPVFGAILITKSLRLGTNDIQVEIIQKLFNRSDDTRVSISGAGSPGEETTYFGGKTLAALKKFQLKYNIVKSSREGGYGTLGPLTKRKINDILGGKK